MLILRIGSPSPRVLVIYDDYSLPLQPAKIVDDDVNVQQLLYSLPWQACSQPFRDDFVLAQPAIIDYDTGNPLWTIPVLSILQPLFSDESLIQVAPPPLLDDDLNIQQMLLSLSWKICQQPISDDFVLAQPAVLDEDWTNQATPPRLAITFVANQPISTEEVWVPQPVSSTDLHQIGLGFGFMRLGGRVGGN